jgi:hypothetical protein
MFLLLQQNFDVKRIFSIIVVTVAVITLLISSIVPHHHHGDKIYIAISHCDHGCGNGRHECEKGDSPDCFRHHHHHENEDETFHNDCVAKATYVVSDQSEIKYKIRSHCGNNHNIYFVPIFLRSINLYDPNAKFVYLTKHKYKKKDFFHKSENVNHTNGLRAPPYSAA